MHATVCVGIAECAGMCVCTAQDSEVVIWHVSEYVMLNQREGPW